MLFVYFLHISYVSAGDNIGDLPKRSNTISISAFAFCYLSYLQILRMYALCKMLDYIFLLSFLIKDL